MFEACGATNHIMEHISPYLLSKLPETRTIS